MKTFNKLFLAGALVSLVHTSCTEEDKSGTITTPIDTTVNFIKKHTIQVGGEGAAEISAFDANSKNLFIVNVESQEVSIYNIEDLSTPIKKSSIALANYGSPNSVAVYNGKLAVAVEADVKQNNGKVLVYNASTSVLEKTYDVGALPDMVTFSKDGKLIICANEGEPNNAYTVDPMGTVSIIEIETDLVSTLDFTSFNSQEASLENDGFRVFGPGADLAKDVEPEYIAVSKDSKTAWVSLQENNGIAKINLVSKSIEAIFPLGFKDYNLTKNAIDASDKDGETELRNWNVKGIYQPDAITAVNIHGVEYIISANEGDSRDYDGFSEEVRVEDLILDESVYPVLEDFQNEINLGRLKTTTTLGDANNDGKVDQIYSYGARSFSIWSANGNLIYDSANSIAMHTLALTPNLFNGKDKRSDDKGAEPESVEVLNIGDERYILFVGLERNNQVMVYDISNPTSPEFLTIIENSGDIGPEGLLSIPAADSPTGKALLVVSNEVSGTVTIYEN
ncbi:choice-of-anchor I family protein [Bacteroidota bacterium]